MVLQIALLKMLHWLCILSSAIFVFFDIGSYLVPLALFTMLFVTVALIPILIAWNDGSYRNMLLQCVVNIFYSIFIYSIIYLKSGLIVNGVQKQVDIITAIYFSGTTWTTVGYGDISAPDNIKLLTTIEAINGYFAMAVLMALIILWINDALKSARRYSSWLNSASKEDVEKATGLNIDELAKRVKNKEKKG